MSQSRLPRPTRDPTTEHSGPKRPRVTVRQTPTRTLGNPNATGEPFRLVTFTVLDPVEERPGEKSETGHPVTPPSSTLQNRFVGFPGVSGSRPLAGPDSGKSDSQCRTPGTVPTGPVPEPGPPDVTLRTGCPEGSPPRPSEGVDSVRGRTRSGPDFIGDVSLRERPVPGKDDPLWTVPGRTDPGIPHRSDPHQHPTAPGPGPRCYGTDQISDRTEGEPH